MSAVDTNSHRGLPNLVIAWRGVTQNKVAVVCDSVRDNSLFETFFKQMELAQGDTITTRFRVSIKEASG